MPTYNFVSNYKDNIDALHSFALKLTRNKMDADDLVQETAIKAYRNFKSFKADKSFKNWSFTILKNIFITKYNAKRKRNIITTPIEEVQCKSIGIQQFEPNPYSEIKLSFVKKSIETLSSKSKEPFEMHMNGYSYKEISHYLDIPLGTVKSRINFAKRKLKQNFVEAFTSNQGLNRVA